MISRMCILAVLLFAGCSIKSTLSEEMAANIPEGANTVFVRSTENADTLYARTKRLLMELEFTIKEENDISRRIVTNPKRLGQNTGIAITLRTSTVPGGAEVEALGQWSTNVEEGNMGTVGRDISGQDEDWYRATWMKSARDSYAFGEMVNMFQPVADNGFRYETR